MASFENYTLVPCFFWERAHSGSVNRFAIEQYPWWYSIQNFKNLHHVQQGISKFLEQERIFHLFERTSVQFFRALLGFKVHRLSLSVDLLKFGMCVISCKDRKIEPFVSHEYTQRQNHRNLSVFYHEDVIPAQPPHCTCANIEAACEYY